MGDGDDDVGGGDGGGVMMPPYNPHIYHVAFASYSHISILISSDII